MFINHHNKIFVSEETLLNISINTKSEINWSFS